MKYEQKPNGTSAIVSLSLRTRCEVREEGGRRVFDVPGDVDAATHRRLIAAGHRPLEPQSLPSGVTYEPDGDENGESGRSSGSGDGEADGSEESSGGGESNSGGESGAMTADRLTGSSDEPADPPAPLDEMNRSELYQYGNEELNLGLAWSGDDALNEAEMREAVKEAIDG